MERNKNYVFNVWRKLHKHWGFSSLHDIHKQIKSVAFMSGTNYYRSLRAKEEKYELYEAKCVKLSFMSFSPSGIFDETKNRSNESLIEYTGLMVLDIDKLESKEKVDEIFNKVLLIEYTSLAFISPSGYGIKIIVATNNEDAKNHTIYYKNLLGYYQNILNVNLDSSTCDVARLCFLSYDPNAYYNPNAKIFEFEELTNTSINSKVIEKVSSDSVFDLKMNEVIDFTTKLQPYNKGNRNNFVFLLAKNCSGFGINKSDIEEFIISSYSESDFTANEIQNSIDSAYSSNKDDFGKWKTKLNSLVNLSQKKNKLNSKSKIPKVSEITFDEKLNHYSGIFLKNVSKENHDKFLTDDNFALGVLTALEVITNNDLSSIK